MTPAQVRAAIAAGTTAPIYLLESDDVPSRLELSQAFLGLVEDGLEAFTTPATPPTQATATRCCRPYSALRARCP